MKNFRWKKILAWVLVLTIVLSNTSTVLATDAPLQVDQGSVINTAVSENGDDNTTQAITAPEPIIDEALVPPVVADSEALAPPVVADSEALVPPVVENKNDDVPPAMPTPDDIGSIDKTTPVVPPVAVAVPQVTLYVGNKIVGTVDATKHGIVESLFAPEREIWPDDAVLFEGWYTQEESGEFFEEGTRIVEDLSLYARFTHKVAPAKIYVLLFVNGVQYKAPIFVENNRISTPAKPENPLSSSAFLGWYTQPEGGVKFDGATMDVLKHTNLYAQYAKDKFTISFKNAEGIVFDSYDISDTDKVTETDQELVVPKDKVFLYWSVQGSDTEYIFGKETNKNLTLVPIFDSADYMYSPSNGLSGFAANRQTQRAEEATYTVTYLKGDATSGVVPVDTKRYKMGDTVTVLGNIGYLTVADNNKVFACWQGPDKPGAGLGSGDPYYPHKGDTFEITGDMTLTAFFAMQSNPSNPPTYTITFLTVKDGAPVAIPAPVTFTVTKGTKFKDAVTVPTFTAPDGYVFDGWAPELPADDSLIVSNQTYIAKFAKTPPTPITVISKSAEKEYDGLPLTAGAEVDSSTPLKIGDELRVTGSTITNFGTKTNAIDTVQIMRSGTEVTDEYAVTINNAGSLEITKCPVTIKIDSFSKVVGSLDPIFTAKTPDIVAGQTLDYTLSRAQSELVGIYPITADVSTNSNVNGNYLITQEKGTLTITAAPPVVIPTPTPAPEPEPEPEITPAPTPTPTPRPTQRPTPAPSPTPSPVVSPSPSPSQTPPVVAPTVTPSTGPDVPQDVDTPTQDGPVAQVVSSIVTGVKTVLDDIVKLIADGQVALSGGFRSSGAWAVVNLILTILTTLSTIVLWAGYFVNKKNKKGENSLSADASTDKNNKKTLKRKGIARFLSIIPTFLAILVFIITENITLPMVLTDRWTLLMAVIALVQVVIILVSVKKRKEPKEKAV